MDEEAVDTFSADCCAAGLDSTDKKKFAQPALPVGVRGLWSAPPLATSMMVSSPSASAQHIRTPSVQLRISRLRLAAVAPGHRLHRRAQRDMKRDISGA